MTSMTEKTSKSKELTGRKVLIIALCAFGVVLTVNLIMMTLAVSGFPGLVTKNPYAEAQRFDAEVKAEKALGWRISTAYQDGSLHVAVVGPDGDPAQGVGVSARIGRPATDVYDRIVALKPSDDGAHEIPLDLAPGVWRVELTAVRPYDGARFTIADQVRVGP
ncbi:MAG: FixH family protein [Pseudomonadota bacterium]